MTNEAFNTNEKRYFAAANTGSAFRSFYGDIFCKLNKLYIIKGGPGTGKSKLMRDIANEGMNKNYNVEYFYCSSDPSSLDGIIITDLNIAVLDGTAPHILDPIYPGAYDEIINLGDFWKTDKLVSQRSVITALCNRKAELFSSVYHYLAAAEMIYSELLKIISPAILSEKLHNAAVRLQHDIHPGTQFRRDIRLNSAISMDGIVEFDTFAKLAQKRYILRDRYGIGHLFLKKLYECAVTKKQYVQVSYSPLNPSREDGIYFPAEGTAFVISNTLTCRENTQDKIINMERFIDKEIIRQNRAKIRFGQQCFKTLMNGAVEVFEEIKKVHFSIEEIYIAAMDFKKKEDFTKKLLIKIFK